MRPHVHASLRQIIGHDQLLDRALKRRELRPALHALSDQRLARIAEGAADLLADGQLDADEAEHVLFLKTLAARRLDQAQQLRQRGRVGVWSIHRHRFGQRPTDPKQIAAGQWLEDVTNAVVNLDVQNDGAVAIDLDEARDLVQPMLVELGDLPHRIHAHHDLSNHWGIVNIHRILAMLLSAMPLNRCEEFAPLASVMASTSKANRSMYHPQAYVVVHSDLDKWQQKTGRTLPLALDVWEVVTDTRGWKNPRRFADFTADVARGEDGRGMS